MKKALKAELTSIAHQILQLKSSDDISKLKALAGRLYEKLSVLEFTEQHFDGPQPTLTRKQVINTLETSEELVDTDTSSIKEQIKQEAQPEIDRIEQKKNQDNDDEELLEIYKKNEERLKALEQKHLMKNDMAHIGGVSYDDLPEFEPVTTPEQPRNPKRETEIEFSSKKGAMSSKSESPKPKSLNDKLNTAISIGLNDRLAFIKQLFDGNAGDYNRVLSQLNTKATKEDAILFLDQMIKPDYNHWKGKELYEERFKEIIERKFD